MASSDSGGGGAGAGVGDSSGIGSIVWVRRRNGSWWPGKILGPDELSASHLMSPRSGTPVKLLGREDASVDWYNLEKSKRVKAFRCGDFDDCIERAEASLGMPAKKREKYARREDAVLHALELEKQLHQKYVNLGSVSSSKYPNSSCSGVKGLPASSETPDDGNPSLGNQEFPEDQRKLELSVENECNSIPVFMDRGDDCAHLKLEYDSLEVIPRRSGLLDYGPSKAPIKKMNSSFPASNGAQKAMADPHTFGFSNSGHFVGKSSDVNHKKRPMEVSLEESIAKRRDRRRPLAQVFESAVKLPDRSLLCDTDVLSLTGEHIGHGFCVRKSRSTCLSTQFSHLVDTNGATLNQMVMPIVQPGGSNPHPHPHSSAFTRETSSGSSEETESDSSGTDSTEGDTDPQLRRFSEKHADMNTMVTPQNRLAFQGLNEGSSSEAPDVSSPDDSSQYQSHDPVSPFVEVAKWQLKGKRNARKLPRSSMNSLTHDRFLEGRPRSLNQRMRGPNLSFYHDNGDIANEVDLIGNDIGHHEEGFGNRGYLPNLLTASRSIRQRFPSQQLFDREGFNSEVTSFKRYLDRRASFFNLQYVNQPGHEILLDVDLKVQAKQTRDVHVPWVSLMSKLNGQAIVGHPIPVEIVEDGATETLLSGGDAASGSPEFPTVWRSDRRTTDGQLSFPLPHLSALMGGGNEADNQYFDQDRPSQLIKKSAAVGYVHNKSSGKRSLSHAPKPPQHGMKRPRNKESLSPGQKTRTLSSMGISQKNRGSYFTDGMLKFLASSGPPTVACIPVKLVFSRLLEAVGRPPSSGHTSHGVSLNSSKEKNPF